MEEALDDCWEMDFLMAASMGLMVLRVSCRVSINNSQKARLSSVAHKNDDYKYRFIIASELP